MAAALLGLVLLLPHIAAAPRCDPAQIPIAGGWGELEEGGEGAALPLPPRAFPHPHRQAELWVGRPLGAAAARARDPQVQSRVVPGPAGPGARRPVAPAPPLPARFRPSLPLLRRLLAAGLQNRSCGPGGKWSGVTAVCDDGSGDCPAPPVPAGGSKEGSRYRLEDSVRFRCGSGLVLLGSAVRRCLEGGVWSGTEPQCRDPYSFDTPEDVASSFMASLSQSVERADSSSTHDPTEKRRIRVEAGAALNVFLLLDASRSVGAKEFGESSSALQQLVEKIASYGVDPRYGIITFGTEAHVVLSPTDPQAADGAHVGQLLQGLNFDAHGSKPGTNPHAAFKAVYSLLVQQERMEQLRGLRPPPVTNSTRHVIVIFTDGRVNMGGSPLPTISKIRELLSIGRDPRNDREDFLDIYVFGVGELSDRAVLNSMASKKDGEEHVWVLRELGDLHSAFHAMIDESAALGLCGIAHDYSSATDRQKNPWSARLLITRPESGRERCAASLISRYFVLTAAHCFRGGDSAQWVTVSVGAEERRAAELHIHPQYDLGGRIQRGVPEFYDYDVALVQLQEPLEFSDSIRPLCLPCTEVSSRALRLQPALSTCTEHRRLLLPPLQRPGLFRL
ncbi:LOW QUALITY PROTEIN: complement factor B-like [Lagopus muta]|uniref:LOW QUALITY PROTEIN: complement factor B-like n=1 Tax=Lagopus muta TaxID=64668 RepID=UPI00209FB0EA|nr:LOW QUALITY PROTEIN: complement factor B-like [Lagopus muta]